jgi:hypothetical protein
MMLDHVRKFFHRGHIGQGVAVAGAKGIDRRCRHALIFRGGLLPRDARGSGAFDKGRSIPAGSREWGVLVRAFKRRQAYDCQAYNHCDGGYRANAIQNRIA